MGIGRFTLTVSLALLLLTPVAEPAAAGANDAQAGWSILSTPNPAGSKDDVLYDVACMGSTDCMAVGEQDRSGRSFALAERWDGSTWSIVDTPNPRWARHAELVGVSCAGTTMCSAVGFGTSKDGSAWPIAMSWDGATWTLQDVPAPPRSLSALLFQVSCTEARACTAVGTWFHSGNGDLRPLIERWDGSAWSLQDPNVPRGGSTSGTQLIDVSCFGDSACVAVGVARTKTIAERWDGRHWAVVPTPSPGGKRVLSSYLFGVSCPGPNFCAAVGQAVLKAGVPPKGRSFAMRWDGSSWTLDRLHIDGSSTLNAVSCAHMDACIAVGQAEGDVLAERWDGATWQRDDPLMPPGAKTAVLWGSSCVTASSCMATGASSAGRGQTLAERYSRQGAQGSASR
jgi:hypothetical protein